MIKLLGVLCIIVGFALRLDPISVVVVAAVVTGLSAQMPIVEILSTLGQAFVDTRYISLFILTLPVIGILERHGLRETASRLIDKIKNATPGRILSLFVILRTLCAALSIRISGHVQFIRPVVYPMVKAAADKITQLSPRRTDELKALSNSMENYGNFFGQNIFVAAPGVLMIVATLQDLGINIDPYQVAIASIPIGISATTIACIQNWIFDYKIRRS